MSDVSQGPGWWQASDGKWYPPDAHPTAQLAAASKPPDATASAWRRAGTRAWRIARRRPRLSIAAAVLLLLLVVAGIQFGLWSNPEAVAIRSCKAAVAHKAGVDAELYSFDEILDAGTFGYTVFVSGADGEWTCRVRVIVGRGHVSRVESGHNL